MELAQEFWEFCVRARSSGCCRCSSCWLLFGGLVVLTKGIASRAVHLHAVLRSATLRILGISAFYHDSAAALVGTGGSSPRRRKSASPARSTMPAFRANAHRTIACRGAACALDDIDPSCSTTSRS